MKKAVLRFLIKCDTIQAMEDSLRLILRSCRTFFFFLIQFNIPFKIISAHMRRANQ